MTAKPKTARVSSFKLGMNTRQPDFQLRKKDTRDYFMREITNADVLAEGPVKRRAGYARVLTSSLSRSIWSDGAQAYYAAGTAMQQLTYAAGTLTATAVTGATLNSSAPVSFAPSPLGGAYWTDGTSLARVVGTASAPMTPATPTVLPVVTQGSGALEAGTYRYCHTYTNADGAESAATHPVTVEIDAGESLIFTLGGAPAAGLTLRTYVSLPNGQEMYRAAAHTAANAQTVANLNSVSFTCMTVGLAPMPAGRFVRYSMGRLVVAVGSVLFYSKPYMHGLYDPTAGYIPFPAAITVVEPITGEGLYVVADKTYWLAGNLEDTKAEIVAPFGAAAGSGCVDDDGMTAYWLSPKGIMQAKANGIELLQDENVSIIPTADGVCLPIDKNGVDAVIAIGYGAASAADSAYESPDVAAAAGSDVAWLVALDTQANWRYTNYAFTGLAEIAGHYFGTKADGVYLLEGATDAGTAVVATIDPGRQDFNSPTRKRMDAIYVTARSEDPLQLTIGNDTAESFDYLTRRSETALQQQRVDVGRGINGAFLSFQLTNPGGGDFELAGMELMAVETGRRLR